MTRILIADDDAHVRRVLAYVLKREGYHVVEAPNGMEALKKIKEQHPDALVTDLMMPRLGGRELVKAIEAEIPARDFAIFLMTSRTEREDRDWYHSHSNIEFLEKPISPKLLLAKLEEYFLRKREGRP